MGRKYLGIFIGIILSFLTVQTANAQVYKIKYEKETFSGEIRKVFDNTQNIQAIRVGRDFDSLWALGDIGPKEQERIMRMTQDMIRKGFRARPHLQNFFEVIVRAKESDLIVDSAYIHLIEVLDTVQQITSGPLLARYFVSLRDLFKYDALFYSSFNRLYIHNGSIDFEYITTAKDDEYMLPDEEGYEEENKSGAMFEEYVEGEWVADDEWSSDNDGWGDTNNDSGEDDSWGSDDGWEDESWGSEENDSWDTDNDGWGNIDNEEWGDGWAGEDHGGFGETSETFEESPEEEMQSLIDILTDEPQPFVQGFIIKITEADLSMASTFDTALIENTSGKMMLQDFTFVGDTARFNWEIAGLPKDSVYCDIGQFNFKVSLPKLSAENVQLHYVGKLKEPARGALVFESRSHSSPNTASFPRFKSYTSNIEVENIGPDNLYYKGGFSLTGNDIYSSSIIPGTSRIELIDGDSTRFKVESDLFSLKEPLIVAKRSKVTLYLGEDSIYHPMVKFKYNTDRRYITMIKDKGEYKNTPLRASYYEMDIYADILRWDLAHDSLHIDILNAKAHRPARFESIDFFHPNRYSSMQGLYNFHPLRMVIGYARKKNTKEFYVDDLAKYGKQNVKVVRGAMNHLHQNGYIKYDSHSGLIQILRKGYHYNLSNFGRKDFDDIMIPSMSTSTPSATMNFAKKEMTLRGVSRFDISKKLDVFIIPSNKEITLLGKRNFTFDGQLFAGNFEFIGKNFEFKYDSFLIDLKNIDSVRLYVKKDDPRAERRMPSELNEVGRQDLEMVTVITYSTSGFDVQSDSWSAAKGMLYLNLPNNKSGRKHYPQYPIFVSSEPSVIYFDQPHVLNGAYDKSLYFEAPPYTIDSLSSSDPAAIGFEGVFVSSILPTFETTLRIMPDNTMGFMHQTPEEGFEIYGGGHGKFYDTLTMTSKGLRGQGRIDYLTTHLKSPKFVFYLDSITTERDTIKHTSSGTIARVEKGEYQGTYYPQIEVDNYHLRWDIKGDSMHISNVEMPIEFYGGNVRLDGTATIRKSGVYGSGKLDTRGSEAISREYTFFQDNYLARHTQFSIASSIKDKPAFAGEDVSLNFNMKDGLAEITPEIEGDDALSFPYTQVKSSITKAIWNLNNKKIVMSKPDNVAIEDSYFYSTREDLDSLVFSGTEASYDIESSNLSISGIPYIIVGDAYVIPESNKVTIQEGSNIEVLRNAEIIIDTLNEFHTLTNAEIDIISRSKFEGIGRYQFINNLADTFSIDFEEFALIEEKVKRKKYEYHTESKGTVEADDKFIIAEGMVFKGEVRMYATKEPLELDGYIQLTLNSFPDADRWIRFISDAEQSGIIFDFEHMETEDETPLSAGIHYNHEHYNLYGTLLSEKQNLSDESFFNPAGLLSFDEAAKKYQIIDKLKLQEGSYAGKSYQYDDNDASVVFEGAANYIKNNSNIEIISAVNGRGNIKEETYETDASMLFTYKVPSSAIGLMAKDLKENIELLGLGRANDLEDSDFLRRIAEFIGDKKSKEYEKANYSQETSLISMSGKTKSSISISKANMIWSSKDKAWYSKGMIGVSSILDVDIDANMEGYIEIKQSIEGEKINILLRASADVWYYFGYDTDKLITFTSNNLFNKVITEKSKIDKAKFGQYVFVTGELADVSKFAANFRMNYLGISEEISFNMIEEEVSEEEFLETMEEDDEYFGFEEEEEEEEFKEYNFEGGTSMTNMKPGKKSKKSSADKKKKEKKKSSDAKAMEDEYTIDESSEEEPATENVFGEDDDSFESEDPATPKTPTSETTTGEEPTSEEIQEDKQDDTNLDDIFDFEEEPASEEIQEKEPITENISKEDENSFEETFEEDDDSFKSEEPSLETTEKEPITDKAPADKDKKTKKKKIKEEKSEVDDMFDFEEEPALDDTTDEDSFDETSEEDEDSFESEESISEEIQEEDPTSDETLEDEPSTDKTEVEETSSTEDKPASNDKKKKKKKKVSDTEEESEDDLFSFD